ncbi:MAG: methyltransferase [candidate division Zixibacteria bacterium SM23_81]|nr:MAG: methyltransferase [candidate division Zixibacteria bacterium SM23_81]
MEILASLADSLIRGQADEASLLTTRGIKEGLEPLEVLNKGLIAGMDVVGQKFRDGELYVPDVLVAARAMRAGMDILRPLFAKGDVRPVGKVILGTVQGDLHDIGKNLVGIMLEGAGFQVIDMGTDVAPEKFISAVRDHQPRVLGMSALLTVTMMGMKTVLDAMDSQGLRKGVVALVGGAPVTQRFADEIGADGYAHDAVSAVSKVKELLKAGR